MFDWMDVYTKFYGVPVTMKGADFHLSGAEAQAVLRLEKGCNKAAVARGVLEVIAYSLKNSLDKLYSLEKFSTVVIGGGVSASSVIRKTLYSKNYRILFADPRYSTDNACGVALIGDKLR